MHWVTIQVKWDAHFLSILLFRLSRLLCMKVLDFYFEIGLRKASVFRLKPVNSVVSNADIFIPGFYSLYEYVDLQKMNDVKFNVSKVPLESERFH